MPIDINSLFADIIDTPEQRQQKLLQQGMVQGQLLSSGLRGRAAALAPLAQMAGQLGVQRQEDLRRAVQPMLGIDPRTTGERLQDQLKNIDTSTPQGKKQLIDVVQQIDPVRAASLRQQFAEEAAAKSEQERKFKIQERGLTAEEQRIEQQAEETRIAQQQVEFNIRAQDDLVEWRNQQAQDADADRLLQEEELEIKRNAQKLAAEELGSRDRAALREVEREADAQQQLYEQANNLAREFQSIEGTEGSLGRIAAKWRSVAGDSDKRDILIADFKKIVNSAALGGLPPGAASDKDIQMVLQGFPDENYPPEAIASYMRGMAKMSAIASEKEKQRMKFMLANKGVGVGIDSTTGEPVTFLDIWQQKIKTPEWSTMMEEKYPLVQWDTSEFVSPRNMVIQRQAQRLLDQQQNRGEAAQNVLKGSLF